MKKAAAVFFFLMLCCLRCAAKDALQFAFPDAGWHTAECPSEFFGSRCYAPLNQTGRDFREMYIFSAYPAENTLETAEKKQIFHDSFKYKDITIHYAYKNPEDIMFLWCSKFNNTCAANRIFKGRENIISAIYLNRAPHYSQNMFGRQTNILAGVKVYEGNKNMKAAQNSHSEARKSRRISYNGILRLKPQYDSILIEFE